MYIYIYIYTYVERDPSIIYKHKIIVNNDLETFDITTNIMLNKLDNYDLVNLIFDFVGHKPTSWLCVSYELYKQGSRAIKLLSNYLFNDNQDELLTYDNITTRYITHRKSKTHTCTNYIRYDYILYSKFCNHISYEYTISIDLTDINVIKRLLEECYQSVDFIYTDKTGDIHIMHGLIKSHNKLTNTLNMRVDIINKKDPTMSI